MTLYHWSGATTSRLPFDVNVMLNLCDEIPPHFIHEIKTKGYDVNVFPPRMIRFSRKKGYKFGTPYTTYMWTQKFFLLPPLTEIPKPTAFDWVTRNFILT